MKRAMQHEEMQLRLAAIHDVDTCRHSGRECRAQLLDRADLMRSGGPWLVINADQVIFDGVNAGFGLGYNSGPLFGVAQYAGAWSGDWEDPDIQAVGKSFTEFVERKPTWHHRSTGFSTPRELLRAYISTQVLDQFESNSLTQCEMLQNVLADVAAKRFGSNARQFLSSTRVADRRLLCEFRDGINPLLQLLEHGVLAVVTDGTRAEIEIPLAATRDDLELLVGRVVSAWSAELPAPASVMLRSYRHYYRYHSQFVAFKQRVASGESLRIPQAMDYLREIMPPDLRGIAELHLMTRENWPDFRQAADRLQKLVYEPVRQTSLSTFDPLFQDPYGYGLLVLVDGQIAGMASAGPLILFPDERGTKDDMCRENRHVLYPVDLTVTEAYRGALGTYLKRGMAIIGLAAGHLAFHGRNRDRLAAAMWAINLSLGSYQIRHLPNDYPDANPFRDCIYYRCPLRWSQGNSAPQFEATVGVEQAIARLLYD